MNEAVMSSPKTARPMLVAGAVSLAAFMEVLDTTIANVALSHIAGSLGASSEESTWVLTSLSQMELFYLYRAGCQA